MADRREESKGELFSLKVSGESEAEDAAAISRLTILINDAYERGEKGMWKSGALRTTPGELRELLSQKQMIIARDKTSR